jgi:hypothetical protein
MVAVIINAGSTYPAVGLAPPLDFLCGNKQADKSPFAHYVRCAPGFLRAVHARR